MNKETKIDKFAEICQKVSELSLKEQNALLENLRIHLAEPNPVQEIPFKYTLLFSSIWFVILTTGGLLQIEPIWFRLCLLPILGIPISLFYIWERRDIKYKISFAELCYMMFIVGPFFSLIGGIILGLLLYLPFKWLGIIS